MRKASLAAAGRLPTVGGLFVVADAWLPLCPMSNRTLRTVARAVLQALPTVLGVVILNFLLLQLVPGDAADVIAAESGSATAESMAQLRSHFGLDVPVLQQLANYLGQLAHFSLGQSPRYNLPWPR